MKRYVKGPSSKRRASRPATSDYGYSLLEIGVVLTILSIMTTVAVLGFRSLVPDYQLNAAVRDIKSDMHMARMTAVRQNSFVVLEFSANQNSYVIYVDDGAGDSTKSHNYLLDDRESTIRSVRLDPHINILRAQFGALGGRFAFNSRGAVDGLAGGVYLKNKKNTFRGVAVSRIGKITIKASTDGRGWQDLN
jgi:Tfp pilus assembly protein FimT